MSLIEDFQKQLRYRIQLKGGKNQSDENCMLKFFKYYDIQNRGEISLDEFLKAMEKIGLQVFSKEELVDVFNAYDSNSNGQLDYKEFSALICRPNKSSIAGSSYLTSETVTEQTSPSKSYHYTKSQINFNPQKTMMESPNELLKRFKGIVKLRGVRGLITLQKIFKMIDIQKTLAVNIQEFKKALRDFKIENLQEQEVTKLFNIFDQQRTGFISSKEFIKAIRGELNEYRRDLAERVFIILDKDNDGNIDISDIRKVYNSKRHPDVMQGKRSEEAVKSEFFESFEDHHIFFTGLTTSRQPAISIQEFFEYYTNLGFCIDSDEAYAILMNNVWNITGNSLTFQALDSNYGTNQPSELSSNNMYKYMDDRGAKQPSGMLMKGYQTQQQPKGYSIRGSEDNPLSSNQTNKYYQEHSQNLKQEQLNKQQQQQQMQPQWEDRKQQMSSEAPSMRSERSVASSVYHSEKIQLAKYQNILVDRFKEKIISKGIKGMIGLRKQFRLLDDDGTGALSYKEFAKAIRSQQINVEDIDIKNAFKAFDLNGNGLVEYDEFSKVLIGPMNKYRTSFVEKAYDKLDVTQQGLVDLDYVISKYDSSRHPDLRLGKKNKQDFQEEFQSTFSAHHYMMHGYQALEKISKQEFIEYYAHVSACYQQDSGFSGLIEGVWSLDYRDNPDQLPFAGSKNKVLVVDPHQRYMQDNFKGKYGMNSAPFGLNTDEKSKTSYPGGASKQSFYSGYA